MRLFSMGKSTCNVPHLFSVLFRAFCRYLLSLAQIIKMRNSEIRIRIHFQKNAKIVPWTSMEQREGTQ